MVVGAVAGSVALVVFVVLHAIWIVPIWSILPFLPVAALVGALAAWPFEEISARGALPAAPFDGLAFSAVLLLTLVPTAVAGSLAPAGRDPIDVAAMLLQLSLAAPMGAALGLLLTGSRVGALALGVAALALALTLGHNLPFFPFGGRSWGTAFLLVVVPESVAGVTFSVARAFFRVAAIDATTR